jgi:alpha-ribazole phosphatase
MEVVLIRHTSVGVPKGTCYGWSDVPVAETFQEEATETKRCLEPLKPFDIVYSSPLTRAKKLADFCGYPNPIIDERLKEMNMGDWEMMRYDDITDPALQRWYTDYMHLAATNGESFPMIYKRVSEFLDELKQKPYKRAAIFAHGGVLICAGIYGGLFSAENAFENLVPYGGIEKISK